MTAGLAFDALIRSSVVLVLGLCAMRLLRRQPAAMRHWVMLLTIVLAAAQPALRAALPEWRIVVSNVLRESLAATTTAPAAAETEMMFEAAFEPRPGGTAHHWALPIVQVWLAGAAFFLLAMLAAIGWLTWHAMRARDAAGAWPAERDAIAAAIGLRVAVRLRETRHPALLVTMGALRPIILLPRGASAWPIDRVRVVLAHELAHIARRDWLVHVAAEIVRACYWPNPLFWAACARLRIEGEQACDDRVLDLGNTSTSYASHLVELARSFRAHGRTWLPAPSMARPSTLERRVIAMLDTHVNRLPMSRRQRCAAALLLATLAVPVAATGTLAGAPGGVLRDPSGRVLPAATVRLSAIGHDAIHETQSDATGTFQFPELPDGDYMLSARLPGFLSARQRVRVSATMPRLDMTLQLGTLVESINVTGGGRADAPRSNAAPLPMPAAPPCRDIEVGGNLKPPMKLKDVRPRYKQEWIDNRVEGGVLLQAVIGVDGRVRNVEVVSPVNADLEEEAIQAVSQWEFSPAYLNCGAVEVRMFVTARFSLEQ